MKRLQTKEVDGIIYPAGYALNQCPYASEGVGCDLGGFSCPLPERTKAALTMLAEPIKAGLYAGLKPVSFEVTAKCNHQEIRAVE